MGHLCGRNMESHMSLIKNAVKALVVAGMVSTLSVWAQPVPAPTTGDAPCAPEPSGAGINDTVASQPDNEGYYSLFDGTLKGWWQSCQTGHSSNSPVGAIFRIGSDNGAPAIYSTQRDGGIGGLLMTKKKFANYEIVMDLWPDFMNDGGLFNRTPANGKCFQTVLDYYNGAAMGGTWGEGGFTGRDYRPFSFNGNENTITIPGNGAGEPSNWTLITQKLKATTEPNLPCANTGCTQDDYRLLWDQNGWNQYKIQFYGGSAANTGNIHMKTWFRKVGATAWVPVSQDTTLAQVVPPNYIGLQVHGGNRFTGPKGTWYKNIKWRPMTDKGEVIINKPTSNAAPAPKFHYAIQAVGNALVGTVEWKHEITVQDLSGKTLETFKGEGGKINYVLKNEVHGWLSIQVKTPRGVETTRVLRDLK